MCCDANRILSLCAMFILVKTKECREDKNKGNHGNTQDTMGGEPGKTMNI